MTNSILLVSYFCKLSGKCCVNNLVPLSPFDIFRIAKNLNLKAEELFIKKIFAYKISRSTYFMEPVIQMRSNQVCPFLEKKEELYKCTIYKQRPFACRIFPLKYDPDNDIYLRNERSEARCPECTNSQEKISINDYLLQNEANELSSEYSQYRNLVEKLSLKGYNVKELSGKKLKQKLFFKIQKLLFETFPSSNGEEIYPWAEVEESIQTWVQNYESEN